MTVSSSVYSHIHMMHEGISPPFASGSGAWNLPVASLRRRFGAACSQLGRFACLYILMRQGIAMQRKVEIQQHLQRVQ